MASACPYHPRTNRCAYDNYTHRYAYTDSYTYAYANQHSNRYANPDEHTHLYTDQHADLHPNADFRYMLAGNITKQVK